MNYALLFTLVFVPHLLFSKDLPEGYTFTQRLADVGVLELKSVQVASPEIELEQSGEFKYGSFKGILELNVRVEGNLCGGNPEDVSLRIAPFEAWRSRLFLFRKFAHDPYSNVIYGCASYSAPRPAKIAFKISGQVENEKVWKMTYVIPLGHWTEQQEEAKVVVKFSIANGLSATIQ